MENWDLTDAISESLIVVMVNSERVMDLTWRLTRRFEVLESLVDTSLQFCPFRKLVLSTSGHQLRLGGPCRRFELVLASYQFGVEKT